MTESKEGLILCGKSESTSSFFVVVIRQQVAGEKSSTWTVFQSNKTCTRPSKSRFSLCVPFKQVFQFVSADDQKKMTDSTQLIVIRGKCTMVLSISSCTKFLTLKVPVTLTIDTDCRN